MADTLKKEDLNSVVVNVSVLQDIFGVGDRMIRYLVEQGTLEKSGRGKYPLLKNVKNYITALKVATSEKSGELNDEDELDLIEEKAKHERVKRQITEIKYLLIKGQVHKSEDVEMVMTDMFEKFKSKILALPAKLSKELESESKENIQKILKKELDDALCELADYNAADFFSDDHIELDDGELENYLKEIRNG